MGVIYTQTNYTNAMLKLLPSGKAWQWPQRGFGWLILNGTAAELARVNAAANDMTNESYLLHKPAQNDFTLKGYTAIANKTIAGLIEPTRKYFGMGSRMGDRLWNAANAGSTWPVAFLRVDSPIPAVLRVQYYRSVVNPAVVCAALKAHKQAHIQLSFEDITGVEGKYYAEN